MQSFRLEGEAEPVLCLSIGLENDRVPLIRLQSECITGEVFNSLRCECGEQFDRSMEKIADYGSGVIIYQRHEGRGIGIENKIKAYALQDQGFDTVDANLELGLPVDARDFEPAALALKALGINECHLLTNNPVKSDVLSSAGIRVKRRVGLRIDSRHPSCHQYLITKKIRMGHKL